MLRLEIYQETAHFRIPTIGNPYLSYLLPPPSTVYGFLRAITGYEKINPTNTKISIQGKFDALSFEKERLLLEKKKDIKPNIVSIQKLHQCFWIIHVDSPHEEKIVYGIQNSPRILRLGRKEDLIIDMSLSTDLETIEFKRETCIYRDDFKIYVPWEQDKEVNGSLFRIALDSKLNEKNEISGYEFVNLIYTSTRKFSKVAKVYDGEYLISWISANS